MDKLHWLLQLHLVRPLWLLAYIPLALLIWNFAHAQTQNRNWANVIDRRLLPHLLQSANTEKKSVPVISLFILGSLVIFALAGPAFEKRSQPVFKAQSALVIVLDLSLSMDATDVKPSRLARAHFKINDILKQRKEGQTALIAYAAKAYAVSPLTDDASTISAQVSALQTSIMPSQGSRLDIALEKAHELFTNAGHSKGHILIVTDGINKKSLEVIKRLKAQGFTSSVLGIGTADGAPIALQNGGFVKNRNGDIVIPKLNISDLRQAANAGGGKFSLLSANDRDINRLMSIIDIEKNTQNNASSDKNTDKKQQQFKTDIWHEEGPWLLLLVIPFAAYAFRKGLIFLLLVFILPLPQPAQALEWSDLWENDNQQGETALEQGEAEKAAELFNDPQWKAAAQYKAGQYQQAADQLKNIDTPDANYNRGNALAKAGQLEQAIKAYDRALEQQADHEDAKYNRELLKKAQQQQKDKKDDKQNKDQNQKDDKKDGQKDSQKDSEKGDQKGDQQENQQNADPSEQKDSSAEKPDNNQSSNNKDNAEQQKDENTENSQDKQASSSEEKEAKEREAQKQRAKEEAEQQDDAEEEKQRAQRAQEIADETPDLSQQQTQQWLKKIPDDPGGLLRRKFQYQYSQDRSPQEDQPW
ncbi:MAG TPA: VWA domain-containing protein [Gammaproteobacteria bacterium]|nr:VWA domain-containing protein [Gammaproteobacteria bacterium]